MPYQATVETSCLKMAVAVRKMTVSLPTPGSRWEKGQVYGCQTEDKIEAKLEEYLS